MTINDPPLPVCQTITVNPGAVFNSDNKYVFNNFASFLQLQNYNEDVQVQVMFNNSPSAIFILTPNTTQFFEDGDLYITSIDFQQPMYSVSPVTIQWVAGVQKG